MNKRLIIGAFIAYVILTSLHRILDSWDVMLLDLFWLLEKEQDLQWYVKDTFDMLGFSIILFALHRSAPKSLRFGTGLFLVNSLIQLPLYYICYLRYDIIINFTIIVVILVKLKYDEKRIDYR